VGIIAAVFEVKKETPAHDSTAANAGPARHGSAHHRLGDRVGDFPGTGRHSAPGGSIRGNGRAGVGRWRRVVFAECIELRRTSCDEARGWRPVRYIRDGFGSLPAFLYGWAMFLAIASGTVASLSVAFSTYLSAVVPLGPLTSKIVSVTVIAIVTAVNVWGTRQSSDLQNWTTLVKVLLILGVCVVLLLLGRGYSSIPAALWTEGLSGSLLSRFGLAMIAVLWAYEGWQFVTYSAGRCWSRKRIFPARCFPVLCS
jgi:hypothetical protein